MNNHRTKKYTREAHRKLAMYLVMTVFWVGATLTGFLLHSYAMVVVSSAGTLWFGSWLVLHLYNRSQGRYDIN